MIIVCIVYALLLMILFSFSLKFYYKTRNKMYLITEIICFIGLLVVLGCYIESIDYINQNKSAAEYGIADFHKLAEVEANFNTYYETSDDFLNKKLIENSKKYYLNEEDHIEYHVIDNCWITGYAPELVEAYKHMNKEGDRYLTASGQWVHLGEAVAVDPNVIPLYAKVIINGKTYTALDTGVIGNVVDIMMSVEEALVYGSYQTEVKWYVEK